MDGVELRVDSQFTCCPQQERKEVMQSPKSSFRLQFTATDPELCPFSPASESPRLTEIMVSLSRVISKDEKLLNSFLSIFYGEKVADMVGRWSMFKKQTQFFELCSVPSRGVLEAFERMTYRYRFSVSIDRDSGSSDDGHDEG
eukprot:TRINITY_DN1716_c0_g1_i1.p1 TRINITY_DN1716_c0_g1~~TRINITY_DN1716_c0_g1_i1.p1  ORF type:complete len:143 (+),score=30.90 TRINITY_DN1716_c0_g1_i1:137-565(+)